jgi:outer membrane protein assembly factor BamB
MIIQIALPCGARDAILKAPHRDRYPLLIERSLIMRRGSRGHTTVAFALGLVLAMPLTAALAYDWLEFNGSGQHSGNNTQEVRITAGNVNSLQRLFQVALPDIADGAPAYLSNVGTSGGLRDLLFVTTKSGHIVALDARTGAQVWSHQNPAGACKVNNGSSACYTTSSPAVDPNRHYVYSYGLDGKAHKYRAGDGVEIIGGGWPELATLKGYDEKGSSALSITTAKNGATYLYVSSAGYPGDHGDYQGHVTVINLADGSQKVFNAVCSDQAVHFVDSRVGPGPDCGEVQTAVWARAGVVYDADTDKIYLATGNGTFDPANHHWGDTVFTLNPDGSGLNGDPLDSYTPTNYQALQNSDTDLGSTAPAILSAPANSKVQHLAVQGGKDAKLRLLNLDNLNGGGGPGHTGGEVGPIINVPQGGQVLTAPAVWVNPSDGSTWVFIATSNGITGFQLTVDAAGSPSLQAKWQKPNGGTSPVVANGVLFYAGSNNIYARDPVSGAALWNNTHIGGIHWESPIVANGIVYITDESGKLNAYSLNGQLPPSLALGAYLPLVLR